MNFSLVYLIQSFFHRIEQIASHWYIGGFFAIGGRTIGLLESLDRSLAWRITLRNIWKPLYQDHSVLGHILAFIFRSLRLVLGSLLYLLIIIIAFAIYIVWAAVPAFLIYKSLEIFN